MTPKESCDRKGPCEFCWLKFWDFAPATAGECGFEGVLASCFFLFGNKYTAKELHWVECFCLEKNPCRVLSYGPARPDLPFIRWRKVATASMQQLSASLGLPRLLEKRVLPTWVVKFQILWDIILNEGYLCLSQVAISMSFLFGCRSMSQTLHVSQKDLSMKNTWTGDLDLIYNAG